MLGMEWILDILLVILLTATLFHAVRLERALGVLKRDRAALEGLVVSFNASTRAAETGVERLHAAADGSGRQIQRQIDVASTLKDDLTFLVQRGEGLADRLDEGVRAARPAVAVAELPVGRSAYSTQSGAAPAGIAPPGVAHAGVAHAGVAHAGAAHAGGASAVTPRSATPRSVTAGERPMRDADPKVRSQAERDLLKALRMAR